MIQSILNFFYRLFIWLFNPLKEAIICFSLGLRDGLHYRLAASSFLWGAFLTRNTSSMLCLKPHHYILCAKALLYKYGTGRCRREHLPWSSGPHRQYSTIFRRKHSLYRTWVFIGTLGLHPGRYAFTANRARVAAHGQDSKAMPEALSIDFPLRDIQPIWQHQKFNWQLGLAYIRRALLPDDSVRWALAIVHSVQLLEFPVLGRRRTERNR